MELLYFRDDQALCTEIHVGPDSVAGITFGWDDDLERGLKEVTMRVVWLVRDGGARWSFAEMYRGVEALAPLPDVQAAVQSLSRTADCNEFAAMLESVGFKNGRKSFLAGLH